MNLCLSKIACRDNRFPTMGARLPSIFGYLVRRNRHRQG
jgi:hypothetical protein